MKKFFALSAFVFAAAVIFSSCKKDFTCECKDSAGNPSSITWKDTKKNAQESCDALNSAATADGGSCSLK